MFILKQLPNRTTTKSEETLRPYGITTHSKVSTYNFLIFSQATLLSKHRRPRQSNTLFPLRNFPTFNFRFLIQSLYTQRYPCQSLQVFKSHRHLIIIISPYFQKTYRQFLKFLRKGHNPNLPSSPVFYFLETPIIHAAMFCDAMST